MSLLENAALENVPSVTGEAIFAKHKFSTNKKTRMKNDFILSLNKKNSAYKKLIKNIRFRKK
ncbi:hypothetical protein LBMAG27_23260 [Bacteroidota bacterium]|nr:hypothetical protein LBMAG27_23260 [Bacteroidota bacterium]